MVPICSRCLTLILTLTFTLAGPNIAAGRTAVTDFSDASAIALGAYIDAAEWDSTAIDRFAGQVGAAPAIVM